jgi:hypothetical protein
MVILLRIFAVLIALRALTNFVKPIRGEGHLVFFGQLLDSTNPLGPLLGVFMLVYAWGLFTTKRFAVPMGYAYAVFATLNIILFYVFQEVPGGWGVAGYSVFALIGIGVSWAAVVLLQRVVGRE